MNSEGATVVPTIENLPDEILLKVFFFLSHCHVLKSVKRVCLRWQDLCITSSLWKCVHLAEISKYNFVIFEGVWDIPIADFQEISHHIEILEILDVDFHQLEYISCHLPNLKALTLGVTCNVGRQPEFLHALSSLTELRRLDINFSTCEGIFPVRDNKLIIDCNLAFQSLIKSLPEIEHLSMKSNFLSGGSMKAIFSECKKLKSLKLMTSSDTLSYYFKDIPVNTTVTSLSLADITIDDTSAVEAIVTKCRGLNKLSLSNCLYFPYDVLNCVGKKCSHLQELSINDGKMMFKNPLDRKKSGDPVVISIVQGCPILKVLRMPMWNLTDEGAQSVVMNCPNICVLDFTGCLRLTDTSVELMASHCPFLQEAFFGGCNKITCKSISLLLTKCEKLVTLNINGCKVSNLCFPRAMPILPGYNFGNKGTTGSKSLIQLTNVESGTTNLPRFCLRKMIVDFSATDRLVAEIANYCPFLHEISLVGSMLVTDEAVHILMQKCTYLKVLNLSWSVYPNKITDFSLLAIAVHGRNIENLKVYEIANITLHGLKEVIDNCANLRKLGFSVGSKTRVKLSEVTELVARYKNKIWMDTASKKYEHLIGNRTPDNRMDLFFI